MLWTVSTIIMKAFITASCHGVVLMVLPRVSLSSGFFHCKIFVCFPLSVHSLSGECGRRYLPGFVPRCRRALIRSGGASLLSFSFKLVCCRREICNILPGGCAAVCSKSASLHPATELRCVQGRASVCSGPYCESSSGPSVLTLALVESLQFSARPWCLPETLRHLFDKKFPGCPHVTWDIFSCRTRDADFGLCSH